MLNIRPYQEVLSDRRAVAFSLAGFVARLPLSMTGIGIVLLVSLTTGSFGLAGLITAAGTVTGAVVAPLWGRAIDRVGQARVLLGAAVINVLSVALLVTTSCWPGRWQLSVVAAVGVGVGFSMAGSAVRARWTLRLNGSPLLNTAFALEAMLDEVVFIIGPVLVTFLATAFHPALGISVSAVIGFIGAVALAVQRSTQPQIRATPRDGRAGSSRLPWRVLVPVAIACAALGMVFGGMEVNVVAFAKEAGVVRYAGVILMSWAFGSLVAGAIAGAITWRASAAKRFRVGAVSSRGVAAAAAVRGSPSGGSCAAADAQRDGHRANPDRIGCGHPDLRCDQTRLTEALAWISTGMAAGVAAGAAVVGQVIDSSGAAAGFVAVVVAGLLLTISALFVRGQRSNADSPTVDVPVTELSGQLPGTPPAESSHRQVGTRSR